MSKKSKYVKCMDNLSTNTQKGYDLTIRKYEAFHGMDIEELLDEALMEQYNNVPPHLLQVCERIEDFQESLVADDLCFGTIKLHVQRIKAIYHKNRVSIPYIQPLNPKQVRHREYIEYKDVLTKVELRKALSYMRLPAQARSMAIIQGGFSNEECEHLTTRAFIDETHKYHQCDNDVDALEWLSDEDHPIIWITRLTRMKTGKPYYGLLGAEAVNIIAKSKLYEMNLPSNDGQIPDKLLNVEKTSFQRLLRNVNKKCGFGLVAEESKLRSHNLRRFHATYIRGGVLSYQEHSKISLAEIDELQGRGKTNVQDTYIKTNPLEQKLIYAKVMNNVSLFNEYDYVLTDDDVVIFRVDSKSENQKLKREVQYLEQKLQEKEKNSEKLNALRNELGDDVFKELVFGILNTS